VVVVTNYHPRKQVYVLVFEDGGGGGHGCYMVVGAGGWEVVTVSRGVVVIVGGVQMGASCWQLQLQLLLLSSMLAAAAAAVVVVVRVGSHSRCRCCCWPYSWVRRIHVETSPGCHVTVSKRKF